jgi:oxygen-independent coproporphyrinogen-3 oxidase
MGVQSFVPHDLNQLGRPQSSAQVDDAIRAIRDCGVEVFNLDLIYGSQDQTEANWVHTVERALAHRPEELFVYPLYVRSLTGLGRIGRSPAENRRHLYDAARDRILDRGYRQISMRMFRRRDVEYSTQHCCQEDGMVGLGPGARSYTTSLHYGTDYAVSGAGVRAIIRDFNGRGKEQLRQVVYGAVLDLEEQMRRYVIRSLLQTEGLDRMAFQRRFGLDVECALPRCAELIDLQLAAFTPDRLCLNDRGLADSDVIGPWLYSNAVRNRMEAFDLT